MTSDADQVRIRTAEPHEAPAISDLALRSKSHWGYSAEFLAACRDELTVTAERCASEQVTVAVRAGRVLGFHLIEGEPPDGELAALFVDLDVIGTGVGGRLLRHALGSAARQGFRRLVLAADPGAEGFYARYGAAPIGEVPSGSIPGRVLPRMAFDLPVS